ncbi:MAG TPA: hypothetical protein VKF62_05775 [Planctomycetota bacterium]|nr:hypothetical protein [Planctomycetota bacterium]
MKHNFPIRPLIGLASVALAAAGCASTKAELPPKAVAGLLSVRDSLIDNKAQVQKTVAAGRDLIDRPRQDFADQVRTFKSAVLKLNGDAMQTRQLGAGMKARADDYFATWDEQLKTVSGELGEAGRERRQEGMASFAKLQERVRDLREIFAPFMSDLEATERLLDADPTPSGVKSAAPSLRKVLDQEPEIMKRADLVISQIDALRGGR